ncbi:MAG: hypothetical protein ACTSV2_03875 [Candidatus Thorarchaeota archaeon]
MDSKSIALLSVFSAMVAALEIFPIPGITDIPVPGLFFTIDWTGIPIAFLYLAFGFVYSFFSITIMTIIIMTRSVSSATYKLFAELFKIIGMLFAGVFLRKQKSVRRLYILVYILFAIIFCVVGMFFANYWLFQLFYAFTPELAYITSIAYMPWNAVQSIINVVGGFAILNVIPEDLARTFSIGKYAEEQSADILELDEEE